MGSRSWCFTINNHLEKDKTLLEKLECRYIVVGEEMGESGTPHLQGFVTFNKPCRLAALKKINNRAHWEPAKSLEGGANYCMKDNIIIHRDDRKQGGRTDLKNACESLKQGGIKKVAEDHPEVYVKYSNGLEKLASLSQPKRDFKPEVTWIWGEPGVGKTRYVRELEPDLWFSGSSLKWWDGYNNQEATIFDDFRSSFCNYEWLLRLLDRYPCTIEVKGGSRELNSKRMYITSCYPPEEVYNTTENINQLLRRIDKIIHLENSSVQESVVTENK